jgi:hypothetical protein
MLSMASGERQSQLRVTSPDTNFKGSGPESRTFRGGLGNNSAAILGLVRHRTYPALLDSGSSSTSR